MTLKGNESSISTGEAYEIVSEYRRRLLLAELSETDTPAALTDLATGVASAAASAQDAVVTESERADPATLLHHLDLPMLSSHDLIAYDPDTRVVEDTSLPLDGDEWLELPISDVVDALRAE